MSDNVITLGRKYKLLPAEATQEMVRAAYDAQPKAINAGFAQAYHDMYVAAPGNVMGTHEAAIRSRDLLEESEELVFLVTCARRLRKLREMKAPTEVIANEIELLLSRMAQLLKSLTQPENN